MNLIQKFSISIVIAALFVCMPISDAHAPLIVDCDLLEATNDAVDDFLDGEGIQFNNVGDYLSSAIQDETLFDQLSALILLFSGGQIEFTGPTQLISTNAQGGLLPQLIDNIADRSHQSE